MNREFVSRETALIKVHTKAEDRAEALRIADIFRANVIDSTPSTYTVEVTWAIRKSLRRSSTCSSRSASGADPDGRVAIAREAIRPAVNQPKKLCSRITRASLSVHVIVCIHAL